MHDSELLRQYARERSETAFRELVQRYVDVVYHAALRQVAGDRHLAQDVAQKVFVALARKAASLGDRPVLVGWLYTCTRLEAAQLIRSERRRRKRENQAYAMNELIGAEPGAAAEWERLRPILDETLGQLSSADREAVLLRFFSGQSFDEVGRSLQVSEEAARKRVDRALDKLRLLLARRGLGSTSAALAGILAQQAAAAAPASAASAIATGAWTELAIGLGAASGVGAPGLFAFMTGTKTVVGIAGALVALAAVSVIQDAIALRRGALRAESIGHETDLLSRGRDDANRRAAALESQVAAANKVRLASSRLVKSTEAAERDAAIAAELARRAELRIAQAQRRFQYGRMFQQLGLTADKISVVQGIMEQEQAPGHDPAALQAQLRDLLGDDGLKQYNDYKRSTGLHNVVDTIAMNAYPGSEPYTGDQARQLFNLLIAHDANYQAGNGTDVSQVDWDSVWAPASQVLSPSQLSYFRATVEAQVLSKQVSEGIKTALENSRSGK